MQFISSKTLMILIGVFLLLCSIVLVQSYAPSLFSKKSSLMDEVIGNIQKDAISRINISSGKDQVSLEKKDNTWTIQTKKASRENIDTLTDVFFNEPRAEIVAQTKNQHAQFKLTDDLSTTIQFSDSLTILVGDETPSGRYIRKKGNDTVYLLKGLQTAQISATAQDWYEKTIVSIEESTIQKLLLTSARGDIDLKREDSMWKKSQDSTPIDRASISQLLSSLSSLQATSVIDTHPSDYPNVPDTTITIETKDAKETITLYKGTEEYMVERASDKQKFLISSFTGKSFLISPSDIKLSEAPIATPT